MDGLILVHKPPQMTSHDVVVWIRKILRLKKVGHFGTLDPFATGLLILALGRATRLFPLFLHAYKTYQATIKLGIATDTYDLMGKPLAPAAKILPDRTAVAKAMLDFTGEILQVPPIYSAKKFQGKPLYSFARKKQKIESKPNRVFIQKFELNDFTLPLVQCSVRCSSGTYIRSLAHDLGQRLGCGAHLVQLVRTGIDPYQLKDSFNLDEIQKKVKEERFCNLLLSMESLLPQLQKVVLSEAGCRLARNGSLVFREHIIAFTEKTDSGKENGAFPEDTYRLFSAEGRLLAFAKRDTQKKGLHPFLVVDSEISNK